MNLHYLNFHHQQYILTHHYYNIYFLYIQGLSYLHLIKLSKIKNSVSTTKGITAIMYLNS